jgi:uncharacterized repeat protein (TIGR01451 family)
LRDRFLCRIAKVCLILLSCSSRYFRQRQKYRFILTRRRALAMRRYTLVSFVILLIAGSIVAWVQAQEQKNRVSNGFRQTTTPPARIDSEFAGAKPLNSAGDDFRPLNTTHDEIQTVAGDDSDGSLRTARRLFKAPAPSNTKSSNNSAPRSFPPPPPPVPSNTPPQAPNSLPALPPGEPELEYAAPPAAMEGVSSVLKKKPTTLLNAPSNNSSSKELKLAPPETNDAPEAAPPTVSSRRIGSGPAKAPTIRSTAPALNSGSANEIAPPSNPAPSITKSETASVHLRGITPLVSVEATGPQAVTIGKPATYTVLAANASDVSAQNVEVRVGIPQWVAIQGGEGTRGEARQETDTAGRQWLIWSVPELSPQSKEQLQVNLTVQQNQPFELAVHWSQKPVKIAAEVAVREPQLDIRLEGPSEMLFGEQKNFTLHINNPGTGDAENVVLEVSSGDNKPNRVPVGFLAAGERKEIPFAVTATMRGEMEIRAVATGEAGLTADAASRVLVRKAELEVAVAAPSLKFAGGEVTYEVAVANVGDATAELVTLSIALPPGAKYVGGLDGAATAGDALSMKVGNLTPNTEKVYDVRCILTQAGDNHFQATAQGKGEITATQAGVTKVEALADLKLNVTEPTGPVPVGSEALYEIRIANRGTKSAEQVQVLVQFAQGLEPLEVAGSKADIADGQAIFNPLTEVAPGKELVLKVRAKVEQTGSHAFRVEVKAVDPASKLVSEGVTRCFADASSPVRATARKTGTAPAPTVKQR